MGKGEILKSVGFNGSIPSNLMESKMENHTATPWTVSGSTIISECDSICGMAAKNVEANAKFIVTACNAHDDLVAALKNIRSFIGYINTEEGSSLKGHNQREWEEELEPQIMAALASVES